MVETISVVKEECLRFSSFIEMLKCKRSINFLYVLEASFKVVTATALALFFKNFSAAFTSYRIEPTAIHEAYFDEPFLVNVKIYIKS